MQRPDSPESRASGVTYISASPTWMLKPHALAKATSAPVRRSLYLRRGMWSDWRTISRQSQSRDVAVRLSR
jgi:hypothetical protein